MRALITVNMDNDAFEECPATELARILEQFSKKVVFLRMEVTDSDGYPLMDSNGNKVGAFRIEEKE